MSRITTLKQAVNRRIINSINIDIHHKHLWLLKTRKLWNLI